MLRLTTLLILSAAVFGFAPTLDLRRSQVLRMAEEDDMVSSSFDAETSNTSSVNQPKNFVRNVETEQKWKDTEINANTKFELVNFSSLFVLVPGILLLNDVFHFLPKEWSLI
eukprot:scaffold746_cov293-Chaetoceros_neogracile.AAC.2